MELPAPGRACPGTGRDPSPPIEPEALAGRLKEAKTRVHRHFPQSARLTRGSRQTDSSRKKLKSMGGVPIVAEFPDGVTVVLPEGTEDDSPSKWRRWYALALPSGVCVRARLPVGAFGCDVSAGLFQTTRDFCTPGDLAFSINAAAILIRELLPSPHSNRRSPRYLNRLPSRRNSMSARTQRNYRQK